MWRSRTNRDRKTVDCIACGASVLRTEAREYDKEGDRWSRQDKEFEHLCKGCYRELDHQPRGELEALVVDVEEQGQSREAFLRRYLDAVDERYGDGEAGDRDVSGLPPGDESANRR
ncbi:hypothetical protein ACFQE1_10045, partial [Halobium palmae]